MSETLAALAAQVIAHIEEEDGRWPWRKGNAPGHAHSLPGIWDDDNGALAGKPCEWCALWTQFKREAMA